MKKVFLPILGIVASFTMVAQTTACFDFRNGGYADGKTFLNEAIDANIQFTTKKNSASTEARIWTNQLRLYQNDTKGSGIIINALNGVTISSVVIYASGTTGDAEYIIDGGSPSVLSSGLTYTIGSISATSTVEFYQKDANNIADNRIYIDSMCVTYGGAASTNLPIANFTLKADTAVEGGKDSVNFAINLSKAALQNDTVWCEINWIGTMNNADWEEDLAHLDTFSVAFNTGSTSYSEFFHAVDDALVEGWEYGFIRMIRATDSLEIGSMDTLYLYIQDNDGNPTISVANATRSVSEPNDSINVKFNIFPVPAVAGTIKLLVTNGTGAVYGTDYTTTPVVVSDTITVDVPQDSSSFSFKFKVIDDTDIESTEIVTFQIVKLSNGLDTTSGSTKTVVSILDNEVAPITMTKIYQIQYTTVAGTDGTFDSPLKESIVTTYGVVTAIKGGTNGGYWIQDSSAAWNGVFVLDQTNTPSRGDSITIEGTVDEFFGTTQIKTITSYTVLKSGAILPTPVAVTSKQIQTEEKYEGVLIKASSVTCVNEDAGFGQWTINSTTTATDSALVDDDMYKALPILNNVYDVTGIGHYSHSLRKILPRDINDISGNLVTVSEVSIYDIQFSTAAEFASPLDGDLVITRGVVTGRIEFGQDSGRFFIQDGEGEWNGIFIYKTFGNVEIGDSVIVAGEVKEYFNLTEIADVSSVTIINSGNPLPKPVDITTAQAKTKNYEGVRVRIVGANCTQVMDQYVNWEVRVGSTPLSVSSVIWEYVQPTLGAQYNVTGIMHWFSTPDIQEYRLFSTEVSDTSGVGIEESILANSFVVSPNPATNTLNIQFTAISNEVTTISIKDILGRELYNASTSAVGTIQTTFDVSNYEKGMYFIQLSNGENQISKRFNVVK